MVFVLSLSTKINQPKNLTLGEHLECQSQVKAGWASSCWKASR
jgi:hypothetical protein